MKSRRKLLILSLCLLMAAMPVAHGAYATLRPGAQGAQVLNLQAALRALGYTISADGKYGPATAAAVTGFQGSRGLKQDGLAGNQTLSALYGQAGSNLPAANSYPQGEGAVPAATAVPPANDYPIGEGGIPAVPAVPAVQATNARYSLGSYDAGVANLQVRLNALGYPCGRTDGVYDAATRTAVINFQWANGLFADGISGKQTLQRLYSTQAIPAGSQATPVPAAGEPQPLPAAGSGVSAVVATGNGGSLRLRSGMSTQAGNVLGTLANGTPLLVLGQMGEWAHVNAGGRQGYVMKKFLSISGTTTVSPAVPGQLADPSAPPATAPSISSYQTGARGSAVVQTGNGKPLNYRTSAANLGNRNYAGQIANGEAVEVLSYGPTWCQISHRGRTGYVMTTFLRFTQLAGGAIAAPTLTPTVSPDAQPTELPLEVPAASPTPPPQDASLFTRILRPGDTGEDVSLLQNRLTALDYVVNENGVFDDTTAAAVRSFQSLNALTVDGKVGSQTAQALMSAGARRADSKPLTYKTLRMGDKDTQGVTAIADMQQALMGLGFSLSVDGSFGVHTHDAVVGFQQANGLTISGIADPQMQSVLFAGGAKGADQVGGGVDLSSGRIGAPGNVQLLHWYDQVKPQISGGQTTQVYHPASGVTFNVQYYSLGRHADAEPKTLKDTQLMNGAFGKASWNVRIVYVKMPSGVWTMAAMHNYPHLYGSISNNGFGGHLCIHFLRDLEETQRTDPNYGMTNQKAIRSAWERLTGKTVE
ncbi:MAG: SH3 domain-containing protein [Clostridiales bacterium]|nr:SH3 domain-containing protein [Clostridiales bacterium]